jgi:hypothetical protein
MCGKADHISWILTSFSNGNKGRQAILVQLLPFFTTQLALELTKRGMHSCQKVTMASLFLPLPNGLEFFQYLSFLGYRNGSMSWNLEDLARHNTIGPSDDFVAAAWRVRSRPLSSR